MSGPAWEREVVEERGESWVDYVWGHFRVAQGHDEWERRQGRPWTLLEAGRYVGTYARLALAKVAAEQRAVPARRRAS